MLNNIALQVVFKDQKCKDCGIVGDHRLVPRFCHDKATYIHGIKNVADEKYQESLVLYHKQPKIFHYHPKPLERFHPDHKNSSKVCIQTPHMFRGSRWRHEEK